MKSWATRAYPDSWLLFLGGLFVLATLFLPKGLVGLPEQLRHWKSRRSGQAQNHGLRAAALPMEKELAKSE